MYEQNSHALLNDILKEIEPGLDGQDLYYFYIRIGANFYAIYSLFKRLYGDREDFREQLTILVKTLAQSYVARPQDLRKKDLERERHYDWFQEQKWTGMALYTNGFGGSLKGLNKRTSYFEELGINLVHVMPIMECPEGKSDGGYAVSNFREIDSRYGSMKDLEALAANFSKRDILLVMDVVVNHTSNEHEWAKKARQGVKKYQNYYYLYDTREIPDRFEETLPEVFPTSSPGNFTWNEEMQKWAMTVFHDYQWDLNYSNPAVFIEMMEIILFWANKGADVVRLDAVAFLWKKLGTMSQNEREAHLILQLMKDCCQVSAPGTLFIAEAIVAPVEINKYFGEDAVIAKECEIAYNATLMALLWDAAATRNSKLLEKGIASLPAKLEGATWLNYVRCHDDIGLGFSDEDIVHAGYEPFSHRRFLIDYYTGNFKESNARGMPFGKNDKTGDARISGSLASLVGLEAALENNDAVAIEESVERILLLHSIILSFGGIPLLYYGDELGLTNDYRQLENPSLAMDSRWINRPNIDWDLAAQRHKTGTVQSQIFNGLRNMISVRKEIDAFADYNNRELINTENDHVFGYVRLPRSNDSERVLILANFSDTEQAIDLEVLRKVGFNFPEQLIDLISRVAPEKTDKSLLLQARQFVWLGK